MFQHILVPLDGSLRAEQALPIAARIARASGGTVHLVQVIGPLVDYSGGLASGFLANEEVIDAETAEATTYLHSQASLPLLKNIKTRIEVSFGQPAPSLLETVKTYGIDLLVICSHGRTGFTRWVLGSVARSLVHQCTIPLLVLRQNEGNTALFQANPAYPLRTLVPLDGSPLAEAALVPAAFLTSALAAPGQGALHLSQVVKIFPATVEEGFKSQLDEETFQHANVYLSQKEECLHNETRDLKLSLTHSVELNSDVASTLENLAEHGKEGEIGACHLIAISTHGRGGLERWVMGSITERLLNATKLPMLIVRPPQEG
jgi:nucleotide-binding universal stress UspA family protein